MKFATKAIAWSVVALSYVGAANAAIIVDGLYDADYGAATASVAHDINAPTSNFGAPGNTTTGADYNVFLTSQGGFVYGLVQITGNASFSAGPFANLYFGKPVRPLVSRSPMAMYSNQAWLELSRWLTLSRLRPAAPA